MIPFILVVTAVLLIIARLERDRLNQKIKDKDRLIRLLSTELNGLHVVIADIESENEALCEDYENAVLALTECQGYVGEAQAARLDFLVRSFVDRRQDEEDLQDEIDAITGAAG